MKTYLALALLALTSIVSAVDTTPPTLNITHTWIEKAGTRSNFKMLLDPQDETGLLPLSFGTPPPANNTIWFRSALNNPNANLSAVAWNWWPWQRGVPFEIGFTCTSCVIEIQARDAAGNASAVQRRVFTSPFPYSSAPDTSVKLQYSPSQSFSGPALDCRGLFSGDTDGTGIGSDIIQVDRASGKVTVRRQEIAGWVNTDVVSVAANTIEDSAAADYDKDGRLDLALLVSGAVHLYHNDGVVSSTLTFSEVTLNSPAVNQMSLSTMTSIAFADLSGEGKAELIVTGIDSGGEARVGWLDNNNSQTFLSGNNAIAPTGSSSGRVASGDVTGDGFVDVVMIDGTNNRVIVFKNDAGARLSGDDDVVTAKRPFTASSGPSFANLPAQSIAVGDVTGDGRADVVVTMHWWASTNPLDSNDTRMHPLWQVLDSRGTSLHANAPYSLPEGPFTAAPTTFGSDVILRDLNNDRFPEIVVTSPFEPGATASGGIRALKITSELDATNQLLSLSPEETVVATNITNPHRLTAARFSANKTYDLVVANNDGTTPLAWIANVSRESTAPVAILGSASTDSDPDGTDGPNGTKTYTVFPNGLIEFSLTLINNTAAPLTNAIFDSLLPPVVTVEDNGGGTIVPSSTSKYVRWTETIPANTAITKHFTARLVSTAAVGSIIQPKNSLKYGSTTIYSYMPKVTLDEPIDFQLLSVASDSDSTGAVVRYGEDIYYRMRLTNRGKTAITNTVVGMNVPSGTKFSGPVTPVPGTTQVVNASQTRIDITVTSLAAESVQDLLIFVEARGTDNSVITNSTITAQRPSGSKRTLAAIKTTIKPAIDIEWYSAYSEFSPRQPTLPTPPLPEPLKGTQVHYGEIIRYRPKMINRSTIAQTNVKLTIPVPTGCVFDGPVSAIPGMTYTTPSSKSIIYIIASIPGSTYNLDGTVNTLSINTDARLDVECRAADYANVTQSATTLQVPGRAIVNPGTYTMLCRPALEIELKTVPANLTSIKPGETITYELQAQNWGANKVTSGKIISAIPFGTKLKNALADDGTGTASPFSSGDFLGSPQLPHELSPTSKPAYILDDKLLVWDLGEVQPRQVKTVRYSVSVATDIGKDYFTKAVLKTLTMDQTSYNFVGTANTGKRIFAFVPISPTYAAPANADPYYMNSAFGKAPMISVAISTSNPLPKPKLQLVKHVVGPRNESLAAKYERLPVDQATADISPNVKRNDWIYYVENDTTVANDAICNYVLHYFNTGGATATNVRVKDVIPSGMTFAGFVAKDQVLMGSFPFSHFYDSAGKELDMNVAANVTKVRSFDLYGGDLAVGESHAFSYQCVALDSQTPGVIITSKRGGKSGSNSGLNYTALAGYQLAADQLHFPVDGSPDAVHVKITAKAGFHLLLKDGWKSGHGMASASVAPAPAPRADGATPPPPTVNEDDNDSITVTMPYDVRSDAGAAPLPPLENIKMTFTLPKGYKTDDAFVNSVDNVKLKTLNASATVEGSGYVSAIRQSNGTIKVTFPLDGIPFAWPTAHIIYDPLYKSTLVDSKTGYTKGGADIEVNLTGTYSGGKSIPAVKSFIHIDSRADADKDTKLFIGRCAPVSVKRGDVFTYTLFFGTLADVGLDVGEVGMTVPAGCEALSASNMPFNSLPLIGSTLQEYASKGAGISPAGTFFPAGTNSLTCTEVRYSTPKPAGTLIKWSMALFSNFGGAVQLKVRALESFTGNAIVDNSCYIKSLNANIKKPGPSSVVVREGDVDGQLAEILQRHLQGVKFTHNTGTTAEINKTLQLTESTCGISIGGADVLQFLNGVNLIPLPHDRVMLIGPPDNIVDAEGGVIVNRTLVNDPMLRINCGPGTSGAVSLINIAGYTGVTPANQVLTDLGVPGLNVLAAKTANVLIGGGNNLVRSGSGTFAGAGLSGANAPALMLPGATAVSLTQLISNNDAKLVGQDGSSIVAGGGGNATTGQGGQIAAPGSAGLIGHDGSTVVANDGAGVIGQSGSAVLSHNGNALIGHDGSTLVGEDGASVVANDGAGLVGQDGSSLIGTGVGSLTTVNTGSGK